MSPKISVIDYGMGNVFSLQNALKTLGYDSLLTDQKDVILNSDLVILPGVGAFADGMQKLRQRGLVKTLNQAREKGIHILGICLGMQLLFEKSHEFGVSEGLGFLEGEVIQFEERRELGTNYKVPHMGWNSLTPSSSNQLFQEVSKLHGYFVHSFFVVPKDQSVIAATAHHAGVEFTAMVQKDSLTGMQFHPEKSAQKGLDLLKAYLNLVST